MRISSLARLLPAVGVAFAVLRCAPPDSCVRESDCGDGLTCHAGTCQPANGAASSATSSEAGATGDASASSSDASSSTKDAGGSAAADAGADAGSDAGDEDAGDESSTP